MFGGKKYILGLTLTTQTLKLFQNHFHSQQVMFKGYNPIQRSVLTQKFIARNEHYFKKRKKENSQIKPLASASSLFGSDNNAITSRRMIRLNKIFMEKITEILMTTHYSSPLMKIGFEITQIKVQNKLSSIHVYWNYSKDTIDDEELNKLLLELSSYLRTELNSQHILGRIPPITFVRDLTLQNAIEVDKRLKNADFGPDDTTEDPINDDIEVTY
ncbi:putative ribosome-binding factor A, mitochondrial, partial [Armadillidium nasatum]